MSYTSYDFPHTNFYESDLREILATVKRLNVSLNDFITLNTIKYADPIQWDITRQYESNTIVIDPQTGTAYISVAPVPAGVALTREEYWSVIFNLGTFVTRAAKNFTVKYEEETTVSATFPIAKGEWVVWGDTLYIANVDITAGDTYVVDGNIRRLTVEEVKNELVQLIDNTKDELEQLIGDLDDLETDDKSNIVAAINELFNKIGILDRLETDDNSNIVAAINEVLFKLNEEIEARIEQGETITSEIGDLSELETVDKDNIVSAINEAIENINKNKRHIKLSELEELTIPNIQSAIDDYDVIDFDVDVDLGAYRLNVGSNKEIYSSNGSIIKGTARIFAIEGKRSDSPDATLTFTSRNEASFVGDILDNREYLIISNQSAIGTTAYGVIGYPNYMGGGTENTEFAYPTIFTNVKVSGNEVQTNIPTYGTFSTGFAYLFEPIFGVYIHDIDIDSSNNHNAQSRSYIPIELRNASNCKIENVRINVGYGNCFTVAASHDVVISGCSATALDTDFEDHYHNNVYRIAGGYQIVIENCSGVGSQPFDITYRGIDPFVSAYCLIKNCQSYANYTCLTTHPGTWACTIDGVTGYTFGTNAADGVSIRGSLHEIMNCQLYGNNDSNSYGIGSVEGCVTHRILNNIVANFQYAFFIHEAYNRPYSDRGVPSEEINGNYCSNCGAFIRLHKEGELANFGIGLVCTNNLMRNNAYTDKEVIVADGTGSGSFQFMNIDNLIYMNHDISTLINNKGAFTLRRIMLDIKVPYASSIDTSYIGNANNIFASIKAGQVLATTTVGTPIPPITELVQ